MPVFCRRSWSCEPTGPFGTAARAKVHKPSAPPRSEPAGHSRTPHRSRVYNANKAILRMTRITKQQAELEAQHSPFPKEARGVVHLAPGIPSPRKRPDTPHYRHLLPTPHIIAAYRREGVVNRLPLNGSTSARLMARALDPARYDQWSGVDHRVHGAGRAHPDHLAVESNQA
jgi:hypothetical protein